MKDYKTAIEEIIKEAFGWEADIDEYGYTSKRVTILIDDLTQALLKLIEEAEYRGIERTLLKLKQAPPIDWLDALVWIEKELIRLAELQSKSAPKSNVGDK